MYTHTHTHTHICVCICICESESEVTQSCPTLCDPMDCSLPGSSVHGIFQARVLEQVAISFSSIYIYIHTHNVILNIRKNEIMPLATTQMDLEMIILRAGSQRKTGIL